MVLLMVAVKVVTKAAPKVDYWADMMVEHLVEK